ncbi:MAG: hypothetical protein ACLTJG_20725, partial [[Clostridium] innocuum]
LGDSKLIFYCFFSCFLVTQSNKREGTKMNLRQVLAIVSIPSSDKRAPIKESSSSVVVTIHREGRKDNRKRRKRKNR